LQNIFPGLWLTDVNAEMYKVHETNQNGRSAKKKGKGKGKGKCFDDDEESSY